MKKIISMVLSFILILGCSTTAFAAETHNYDTENLPHDGADYFETEIKADEENEERISDFVTVYGYQYTKGSLKSGAWRNGTSGGSSTSSAKLSLNYTQDIANDLYAKDISKKISASKQEAMEKGIPTGNVAYGYKVVFNENKVKVMVEDKEAADVVRWIFNEAEKGTLHSVIAAELNAKHILTPAQYRVRHNIEKLEKLSGVKWTVDTLSQILKNEVYIGRYVTGKDRVCLYRHEKRHTTNKDEWYVFENHHIALIAKEQFYAVQKNKRKVIKPTKKQTVNMLKGKIICGCCGSSIHIHPEKHAKVYLCTHRKRYGKDSCNCLPVKVDDVYAAVLAVIKEQIQVFVDREMILKEHHNDSRVIRQEQVYTEAVNKCVKEMDRLTGGMDVAYKNLIYQLYSMDLSRKVKSARRTRNLSGEYTASFVCYGYKKDPDDKHKLIIDEEAAKVVVEIFSLIIAGYNASEVARILNERKIPTRVQNQWKNGINYVPVHNKGDYMWDNSEVIAIVQNEQYKGIMIQNKCETVGFGDNKKVRKRNKEDWSVVEGAIPRIVSDEMFDEVNKMLRVEARGIEKSTKKRKKNLFICPYCGRKLMNSSAVCTPKLLCPKRRMVRTGECQQIFMLKSEAQDKVLEITKEICRTLIQEEELKRASKDKRKVTSDEYLISELKAEYDRISNSTVSCYQSYREGKYTKEEYVQLRKTNQELLADLENQISDLQEKAANQEPDTEEKIEQLTQYSMLEQYDGDVLSNIIDKVLIYNDKDIEVVFKGENFIRNAV